jgi:uncharacterized RDD family membrane protein YckC
MALVLDLVLLAIFGEVMAEALSVSLRLAHQISFGLFAVYYVVAHRVWGRTLGKRLLGLRIQGTTRPVSVPGLLLRFLVEFWGPITAAVMINLQVGAATDLEAVKTQIERVMGMGEVPVLHDSADALLRTVLVPNLFLALPWLGGFLFAFFDDNRQALHDRAARTRVVYALRNP